MTMLSASQEILLEEWKEARRAIGRFDEYLLNLRRYGFTLATILIGADAYLSITEKVFPWAKAGAATALMLLIFALFLLDHHVKTLQSIALHRAAELEKQLGMVPESTGEGNKDVAYKSLSELRQEVTNYWQVTHGGTPIYFLFLVVTGGVGSTAVLTMSPDESVSWGPLVTVVFVCLVLCSGSVLYSWRARRVLAKILRPRKAISDAFTRLLYSRWAKRVLANILRPRRALRKKDKQT